MFIVLAILGSLGGVTAIVSALWVVIRAAFHLVNEVDHNTDTLETISTQVTAIDHKLDSHAERIARLEGRL